MTAPSPLSSRARAPAPTPAYLRHPTLQGDRIAFVADDDLWTVPATGGVARRLTAGLSEPSTPSPLARRPLARFRRPRRASPRGPRHARRRRPGRRLTWLGTDTQVRGWTPAGEIAYVTTQGQPFFRNHQGFAVAPVGRPVARRSASARSTTSPSAAGGRVAIGRNTDDPARWKRYRGGRAGALWVDAEGSGTFRRLDQLAGNVTTPMWIGDRLYFIGDGEGVGNLYSCRADGGDVRRHTDHDGFYARQAQSDGRRIVYACGARLWLFDPAQGTSRELAIETPAHRTQAARRFVASSEHLEWFKPHPAGHSIAIVARGQLFAMPLWEGAPTRRIDDSGRRPVRRPRRAGAAATPGAGWRRARGRRLRRGQWLADGTTMVAASDASGEERLVVFAAGAPRARCRGTPATSSRSSPRRSAAGSRSPTIATRSGSATSRAARSAPSTRASTAAATTSPGRPTAPGSPTPSRPTRATSRSGCIRWRRRRRTALTEPEFRDSMPAFDPEGRYPLLRLGAHLRSGLRQRPLRPELPARRAAVPDRVAGAAGGRRSIPSRAASAPTRRARRRARAAATRKRRAPSRSSRCRSTSTASSSASPPSRSPEGRYGRIAGVAGAKVVWNAQNIVGAHGRGGHKEAAGKLERFDFATGRTETLAEKIDDFAIAGDGVSLVYRDGKSLRAIAADRHGRVASPIPADAEGPASRKNGRIDLDRVRVAVEPRREWRQMLREVWRLQRDQFWSADLSGVDWDAVWRLYAPLLDRVATRADFSDLVWEMQGELGTSHAYETGGDHRKPPARRARPPRGRDALGRRARRLADHRDRPRRPVGCERRFAAQRDRRRGEGRRAHRRRRRPAADAGRCRPKRCSSTAPARRCSSRWRATTPRAASGGARSSSRRLPTTCRSTTAQWVEKNRAWVHERSGGRVGYFHVPDMQAAGFAEFHRYFGNECERDALIVDVRYNRGGHVSQLLLEKVARRRIAFVHSRWMNVGTYPEEAVAGPVVTLTNEHAGSDGDIFSHNVKLMKIGPLVGMRTWGGVVGIWPRHRLVDGSETTQPEFAFWFTDVGFGVENHGTDPDIEVDNAPQDSAAGRDRQLEVALQTALDRADRTAPLARPRRRGRCERASRCRRAGEVGADASASHAGRRLTARAGESDARDRSPGSRGGDHDARRTRGHCSLVTERRCEIARVTPTTRHPEPSGAIKAHHVNTARFAAARAGTASGGCDSGDGGQPHRDERHVEARSFWHRDHRLGRRRPRRTRRSAGPVPLRPIDPQIDRRRATSAA